MDKRALPSHLPAVCIGLAVACLLAVSVKAQTAEVPDWLRRFAGSTTAAPKETRRQGSIYVPAYSELPVGGGVQNVAMSVTLSVRNASPDQVLALRRIELFDTAGELVQSYLKEPVGIRPFGTVNLFVTVLDRRGGSGGNFRVDWAGATGISEPIVEAIMLGELGGRSYSFVSRGREIG